MGGKIRIGISGWHYPPWRGVFYPEKLAQRRELEYASRRLPSIEINGTFYGLQDPESFAHWYDETPPGFVFSVKGSKYITHQRRLKDVEEPLARYLKSGMLGLKEKLGPFLWQFPPFFRFVPERFETFFALLPRDTDEAIALIARHDKEAARATASMLDRRRKLRHAVEIRHESFAVPGFVDMLRRRNIALVVADTAGKWPFLEDLTSDFVYVRLHGDQELYASGYTDEALAHWAERLATWSRGGEPADAHRVGARRMRARAARDVYCYFDNDVKVRAPFDAMHLIERLGTRAVRPEGFAPERFEARTRRRRDDTTARAAGA